MSNPLQDLLSVGREALSVVTPELIVSSNLTPDIKIDLSKLIIPGPTSAIDASQTISSTDTKFLRLIQPEIIITSLGLQKSIAPYGSPRAGMFTMLLIGIGAAGLLGAAITWGICSRIGNK